MLLCVVPLTLSMVVPSFESFLQRSTGAWRGAGYTWSPAEPTVGAAMPLGAVPSGGSCPQAVISSVASPASKASAVVVCGAEGARRGRPSALAVAALQRSPWPPFSALGVGPRPHHLPLCQVPALRRRRGLHHPPGREQLRGERGHALLRRRRARRVRGAQAAYERLRRTQPAGRR